MVNVETSSIYIVLGPRCVLNEVTNYLSILCVIACINGLLCCAQYHISIVGCRGKIACLECLLFHFSIDAAAHIVLVET